MSWKDKNGKNLEADDVVILEGRISGRHSSDRISVTVASGQSVLIDAAICRKGRAQPEPEAEVEAEPETEAQTEAIGDEDAPL